MGFLSARSSVVRFDAKPARRIDRDAICAAVNRHAFREHDEDGLPKAEAFGWVAIHDPLVVELDASDLFFDRYLLIGFRHDRRVAPAKLVRLERRRAEEARKREQGLERLGRAVRKEIKEEVEARLLQQALPSPSLFDCAWNLETGTVFFTGKARAPREAFAALFRETFGVEPLPVIPYLAVERVGLPAAAVDAVRGAERSSFVAVPADERPSRASGATAGGALGALA